ncbi:MAG: S16 family serine protease [Candidatus Micrarchaeia archaeon]
MKPYFVLLACLGIASLLVGAGAAFITSIHAPAVITNESTGTLTLITLNLTPGTGVVSITGPSSVGASTLDSAKEAVAVASSYLKVNQSLYNFLFTISDRNVSVSGPSAGLAFTLLSISALEHVPLLSNFTVSGEILSNGSVSLIGGVYDKAEAAANGHMRLFLLPNASSGGILEELLYYISQSVFKVPIVQVENVSQALPYALGTATQITPFSFNITQHYHLSELPSLNLTCSDCNESLFDKLVNYTLNFTGAEINAIPDNFSSAKQQMLGNERRYAELASKGYAYSAADFAFLQYLSAFALANKANYTQAGSASVLANISAYCSSLVPPMLTNSNYEYVIGGELRQQFANITLSQAQALLNSSEITSDSYIESLYYGAESLAWCKASQELYNISSNISGNYVSFSPELKAEAASAINKASRFGNNLYLESAIRSYDAGNYAVALYAATYASALGNPDLTSNMTNAQLANATYANVRNSTVGTWPYEFAEQALLYLNEYKLGNSSSLNTAYATSVLAKDLEAANEKIAAAFIISSSAAVTPALLQQISEISTEMQQVFALLLVVLILLFAVLVVMIALLVGGRNKDRGAAPDSEAVAEQRLTRSVHHRRKRRKARKV